MGIVDYNKFFEARTLEEPLKAYNKEAKSSIVGGRQQALYLIVLRQGIFLFKLSRKSIKQISHKVS